MGITIQNHGTETILCSKYNRALFCTCEYATLKNTSSLSKDFAVGRRINALPISDNDVSRGSGG